MLYKCVYVREREREPCMYVSMYVFCNTFKFVFDQLIFLDKHILIILLN